MKKLAGWCFALVLVAFVAGLGSPAAAIPPDRPNDNVCICHQTQHHQNNEGDANENQKGVVICVDPSSVPFKKHTQHGDACIAELNDADADTSVCPSTTTEAACLGEEEVCGPNHDFTGTGDACCPQEAVGCEEFVDENDCISFCEL